MANNDISDQVQKLISQGKTKEEIYSALLAQGVSLEEIQAALAEPAKVEQKEKVHQRVVYVVVTIGAVMIAAGIFSFIASNWQAMSNAVRVGVIVVSMLISYGLGWYAYAMRSMQKTGTALIVLGAAIYGAGIFLVAQIYHIRANWPDGFLLWMLGVIALAYAINSYSLYRFAIPLGFIAAISYPVGIFAISLGSDSTLHVSTILLVVTTVVLFTVAIMIRRRMPRDLIDAS